MTEKKDITTIEDVRLVVDAFYGKVKVDPLIGPIFNDLIRDNWPEHLEKMYRFWQTVLLGEHTYFGNPFRPHAKMPIEQKHFDAWLKLWHETIDNRFAGIVADEAKWRGGKMAAVFLSKIKGCRDGSSIPLI